jgi:hypothetical protein
MVLLPFVAAGIFGLSCAAQADTCTIVSGGKAQAAIVLAEKGFPVDTYAAQELQYHVQRATGAKLGIYRESQKPADFAGIIYIGDCAEARRRGLHPETLPPNAGYIRTIGSDLFLTGNDGDGPPLQDFVRAGSLFAVYTFLENNLGVRWLWPGKLGEVVPSRTDLSVSNLQETHKPTLIHSRFRAGGALTGPAEAWTAATAHGRYYQEEVVWLRRHQFGRAISLDIRHAFTGYWARFGRDHPEYFNLLPDGERHPDPLYERGEPTFVSMNVSEPGLWRQIVNDWKAHRTAFEPNIDASENDTFGKDLTPSTLAWDVPDPNLDFPWEQRVAQAKKAFASKDPLWPLKLGSLSDRYAKFWLAVQREAQKDDPDATVMGFAYDNYVEPPRRTRLNDHIIIGIVPPIAFPYSEAMRAQFRRVWDGWSKSGARLMYRPNMFLDGYTMPIFYARKFAGDYAYAYQHGMIATDFDSLTGQWATQGPNLYVLGRLNEHPEWPVDKILGEYYGGFGPAKEEVQAYFEHWEHVTDSSKVEGADPFQFYKIAPSVFTESAMAEGRRLLERAARAAATNSVAKQRVAFLENGLRHAELTLETELARKRGNTAAFKKSLATLDEFRAQHESDFIADMGFLALAERSSWDRTGVPRPNPANIGRKPVVGPNLLANGGFTQGQQGWSTQVMAGECSFATDTNEHHSGQMSARITCTKTVSATSNTFKRSSWARFYQVNVPLQRGSRYRLSVWVKTSKDFQGQVLVWCDSNGVTEGKSGPTNGAWTQVVIDDIQPKANSAGIYLNLVDGTGTVWFDDARLEQVSSQ